MCATIIRKYENHVNLTHFEVQVEINFEKLTHFSTCKKVNFEKLKLQ